MCSRRNPLAELRDGSVQRLGDSKDGFDSWISDTAFDAADVGAVEIGLFSEPVLGKASLVADTCNVTAKRSERAITGRHFARNYAQKMAPSLWTIGYNLLARRERSCGQ